MDYRAGARSSLPPKPLIITMDDGHKSNFDLQSLFAKYNIPVTIFLCSGVVATNRHYWFETALTESMRQALKHVSDQERVTVLASAGFSETTEQSTRQALSAEEINALKSTVDFQSHTVFHPLLPQCSPVRARDEIANSKSQLERNFGLSIYALAYPNGDYSAEDIESAASSGYQCGLTLDCGFNTRKTPPFQLRRICINDDASLDELLVKASGLWGYLRAWTNDMQAKLLLNPRHRPTSGTTSFRSVAR